MRKIHNFGIWLIEWPTNFASKKNTIPFFWLGRKLFPLELAEYAFITPRIIVLFVDLGNLLKWSMLLIGSHFEIRLSCLRHPILYYSLHLSIHDLINQLKVTIYQNMLRYDTVNFCLYLGMPQVPQKIFGKVKFCYYWHIFKTPYLSEFNHVIYFYNYTVISFKTWI